MPRGHGQLFGLVGEAAASSPVPAGRLRGVDGEVLRASPGRMAVEPPVPPAVPDPPTDPPPGRFAAGPDVLDGALPGVPG
jgi:hypothetical protein